MDESLPKGCQRNSWRCRLHYWKSFEKYDRMYDTENAPCNARMIPRPLEMQWITIMTKWIKDIPGLATCCIIFSTFTSGVSLTPFCRVIVFISIKLRSMLSLLIHHLLIIRKDIRDHPHPPPTFDLMFPKCSANSFEQWALDVLPPNCSYFLLTLQLPAFFMKSHDYTMYSNDVEFINGLLNTKTR